MIIILTFFNRNGYDNLGSPFRSYVHFFTGYNNAFWNVSFMSYGDGNGTNYSPLTTLDVCAHELTHGVTEHSSNLIYANESGALNESFSDIAGVSVDYFANPGGANFLIGEQCYTPATPGDALRYMNNPNLANNPDTYLGTFWYGGTSDNGGVHTNSGVQNFWYYLLCQGGSGTNDFGFVYNVAGIGINNARQIAYRNNNFLPDVFLPVCRCQDVFHPGCR
jgi:Zn-dependent metalloprotease